MRTMWRKQMRIRWQDAYDVTETDAIPWIFQAIYTTFLKNKKAKLWNDYRICDVI